MQEFNQLRKPLKILNFLLIIYNFFKIKTCANDSGSELNQKTLIPRISKEQASIPASAASANSSIIRFFKLNALIRIKCASVSICCWIKINYLII